MEGNTKKENTETEDTKGNKTIPEDKTELPEAKDYVNNQPPYDIEIEFDSINREYWIRYISELKDKEFTTKQDTTKGILITMSKCINPDTIEPVHIVLFSCFIQHLVSLNYSLYTNSADSRLNHFLYGDLELAHYFGDDATVHRDSPRENILNIWKITKGREKDYAMNVASYFKRNYFAGCDLFVLENSLDEVYSNVVDHAKAEGNAFSYIHYDESRKSIQVAVCDFGLGIPTTLKHSERYEYVNDCKALQDSLEVGVTAKTNPRNRGFGLDNVVSNLSNNDRLRIVSNNGLILCFPKKNPIKTFNLDFDFKGTLIYFDVCIEAFQKEDNDLMSEVSIG